MSLSTYHAGLNHALLISVPSHALRILDVGCGEGRLGSALRASNPQRQVFGVELHPAASQVAAQQLQQVFLLDIETATPPLEPGSLDCLIFGDVLEHVHDPEEVLRRLGTLLAPDGWVLASIPNIGHHSVIKSLLQGDWQYQPQGLMDTTHLRFFTLSSALKLFLDAGYRAEVVDTIVVPTPESWRGHIPALSQLVHTAPERLYYSLQAYQFILRGQREPSVDGVVARPMTFSVCVSDAEVLHANVLASTDLQSGHGHSVRLWQVPSAAQGHNRALDEATTDWVICLHQDVYLPRGWIAKFQERIRQIETAHPNVAVVGVYGMQREQRCGRVLDRMRLLQEPAPLPAMAHNLDELLIAVKRSSGLRFDPHLGWHLYGTDIALEAQKRGQQAVVIDALCFHNSQHVGVPQEFHQSARYLANKWKQHLPIPTPCMTITS